MTEMLRRLFVNTKNVDRSSYIWNAVAGLVFAMQSALLLMVINRTNGTADAGYFSIGYAVASMMSFIGEFGVRKYQASDTNEINSFEDYYTFRLMSCGAMILACLGYAVYGLLLLDYSIDKFLVMIMISLVKLIEAYVDVFYGRFQQKWRLDIAAKTNSFRIIFGMVCCSAALIITHDLLVSCAVWAASVIVGMFLSTLLVAPQYCQIRVKFRKDNIRRIFLECLPLFIGSFLLLYIGNAPKYAIDAYLDDVSQGIFNFIFMPVFVIGLLANFIFNPVLVKMADAWDKREFKTFDKIVRRQMIIILGLTVLALAVALTIGCPVLGWLFGADLGEYRMELSVLMIGGGALALVNFYAVVVTVIRYQKYLTAGYVIAALAAWALSGYFVRNHSIGGASALYAALMVLLAAVFAVTFIVCRRAGKGKS